MPPSSSTYSHSFLLLLPTLSFPPLSSHEHPHQASDVSEESQHKPTFITVTCARLCINHGEKKLHTTHTNFVCMSGCMCVCVLHYLPTERQSHSALHTVNQWSASGYKYSAPLPSNTYIHKHTHTACAVHNLLKHAVTANRQRGSAANNMRERERAAETIVTSHLYTATIVKLVSIAHIMCKRYKHHRY